MNASEKGRLRQARITAQMGRLPRTVEPWMFYTDAGEMRHAAFKHGQFEDEYHGWSIRYDPGTGQYSARCGKLGSGLYYRKSEIYKWCRDNSQTGTP